MREDEGLLGRLRRINARQPAEDSLALRALVLTAALTAAAAVVDQQVAAGPLGVTFLAGIAGGSVFSWSSRHRPGYGAKVLVALGAVAALARFLQTVAGITNGTVADAQAPLAELLLSVQALHSFDLASRRDLSFSLFVSVVVMAAAGLLSVSMALLPFLLVWTLAAVAALVVSHRRSLDEQPRLASGRPGHLPGPARLVASALAAALALGLAAFFLLPPAGTARALTFPASLRDALPIADPGSLVNPSLGNGSGAGGGFQAEARAGRRVGRSSFGYFGFSTSLDLADRGRPDQTLVMRVRAQWPAFWRAQSFDKWDGRRWSMSSQRSVPVDGPLPLDIPPLGDPETAPAPDLVQTYYLAQPGPNVIFGAEPVRELYVVGTRVRELTDGTLRASVELGPGAVYTVVSRPPLVSAADLRRADADPAGIPPQIRARYGGALPTTARVRSLAAAVTAGATTTFDRVEALEGWIGAHTRYSLDPPPLPRGADGVDRFLFVDRRGFCEQIATSLVVMLRSLGVPARLAVGYAPGLRNPFTGLFEVRASDAHAWAEVWFPGVGWEPFDPTSHVPLAGDARAGDAASGLGTYLAAVLPRIPTGAGAGAGAVFSAAVVGAVLWRRRREVREPEPSWAARCQTRLEARGVALGVPRHPAQTLTDYVAALRPSWPEPAELDTLATVVGAAAFSGRPPPDTDRLLVEAILSERASPAGVRPGRPRAAQDLA